MAVSPSEPVVVPSWPALVVPSGAADESSSVDDEPAVVVSTDPVCDWEPVEYSSGD